MQPTNWYRAKKNKRCLYCARWFSKDVRAEKEHLIARQFVPRDALNNGKSWNFIFAACSDCNRRKSRLEGHVAAVTQFASERVAKDPASAQRAREKADGEFHPWTKRPVANSFHETRVSVQGGSLGMALNLIGPPQLDRAQAYELALSHIQGFYALVHNEDHAREEIHLLNPDWFWVLGHFLDSDWGNRKLRALHERTRQWKQHLCVTTARGYFGCAMRSDGQEPATWFWVLEWNQSTRVAGLVSSREGIPAVALDLPRHHWVHLPLEGGAIYRLRQEELLAETDDDFFVDHSAELAGAM